VLLLGLYVSLLCTGLLRTMSRERLASAVRR